MRWTLASVALLLASAGQLAAQDQGKGKGIRLWNLTTSTISGFQLSPAGKNAWGPNQTLNDRDKRSTTANVYALQAWSLGAMMRKSVIPRRGNASYGTSRSRPMWCFRLRTRI